MQNGENVRIPRYINDKVHKGGNAKIQWGGKLMITTRWEFNGYYKVGISRSIQLEGILVFPKKVGTKDEVQLCPIGMIIARRTTSLRLKVCTSNMINRWSSTSQISLRVIEISLWVFQIRLKVAQTSSLVHINLSVIQKSVKVIQFRRRVVKSALVWLKLLKGGPYQPYCDSNQP